MTRLPSVSDLIIGNNYVNKSLSDTAPKPSNISAHSQQLQALQFQKKAASTPGHDFAKFDKQNLSPNNHYQNSPLSTSASHPNPPWNPSRGPAEPLSDYSSNQRVSVSSSIASVPANSPLAPSHYIPPPDMQKPSTGPYPAKPASTVPKDHIDSATMSNQHPQEFVHQGKLSEAPKSSVPSAGRVNQNVAAMPPFSGPYLPQGPTQLPVQPPMLLPQNSFLNKNPNLHHNLPPPSTVPSQPNQMGISPAMSNIPQSQPGVRDSGASSQNSVHHPPHASPTVNSSTSAQPPLSQLTPMGQLAGQPSLQTPMVINTSPAQTSNPSFVSGPGMSVPRAASHIPNQPQSHLQGQGPPQGPLPQIPGPPQLISPNQMTSTASNAVGGPPPGHGHAAQQFLPLSVPYSMDYLQYYPYQYYYPNQVVYHDPNFQQVPFAPGQPMVAPFGQPMGQYFNYPYDENRALINKRRIIKRRTRTGCLTCRKRRIKCDERKPFCFNCERSRKVCLGYENADKKKRQDDDEEDDDEHPHTHESPLKINDDQKDGHKMKQESESSSKESEHHKK